MKKFFSLTVVLVILFSCVLCSCGETSQGVKYVYDEENLEISFPDDMKVFDLNNLTVSDTDIDKYGFDYDELKDLASPANGGIVYYAKSQDLKKECTVSINATDDTLEVWDFTDVKSSSVTSFAENEANLLTTEFYTIKEEDEYRKNGLFFVRFDMASSLSKKVDTLYLFTVKNGLRYSIVYYSTDLTEDDYVKAEEIFNSIKVTKTISKYTEDPQNHLVPVVLILAFVIVLVIAIVGINSYKKQVRKEKENGAYQKQFQSILDDREYNKSKNNKK